MGGRPGPGRSPARQIRRFHRQEEGGTTALALFALSLFLLVTGVAVDVANLYRSRAMLQVAADAAAQSAVVALSRGEDQEVVRQAALEMIERNLPEGHHGRLLADPATDLQLLHYTPETGRVEPAGEDRPANAALVRLQRSEAAGNPLPTFILGWAGVESWSLAASSVAVIVPTRRCGNAEGIVARGAIDPGAASQFATDFCLHSQTALALPVGTDTLVPLRISLPDPRKCSGLCEPGRALPEAQPVALNLVMPGARDHVARLAAGFLDPDVTLPEEAAFFATRPPAGDPEALREVGLAADNLPPGTVLQMTPLQFSQLRERPAGLVYDVRCDTVENDPRPLWERALTLIGDEGDTPTLGNLVLVTDCAIEMDDLVRIEGTLILMTGPGAAQISALPGASLGDPRMECDPARRVRLMTLGDLSLPAGLSLSNVSAVAGGNILLEDDPDLWRVSHRGLVLDAGGEVVARGSHSFARCLAEDTSDPLMPELRVIAHAMPDLSAVLPAPAAPRPKADLPGKAVERLPGKAGGRLPADSGARPGS